MQVPDLALLALGPELEVPGSNAVERAGVAACKPGQDFNKHMVILVRLVCTIYRYWIRNLYKTAILSMGLPPQVLVDLGRQCCLVNCIRCRH